MATVLQGRNSHGGGTVERRRRRPWQGRAWGGRRAVAAATTARDGAGGEWPNDGRRPWQRVQGHPRDGMGMQWATDTDGGLMQCEERREGGGRREKK